ncbi:MAG: hypothetical protein ACK54L_19330, partial [Betaproteobacteria bacterium]
MDERSGAMMPDGRADDGRATRPARGARPPAQHSPPPRPSAPYSISSYSGSVRNSAKASCVLICSKIAAA